MLRLAVIITTSTPRQVNNIRSASLWHQIQVRSGVQYIFVAAQNHRAEHSQNLKSSSDLSESRLDHPSNLVVLEVPVGNFQEAHTTRATTQLNFKFVACFRVRMRVLCVGGVCIPMTHRLHFKFVACVLCVGLRLCVTHNSFIFLRGVQRTGFIDRMRLFEASRYVTDSRPAIHTYTGKHVLTHQYIHKRVTALRTKHLRPEIHAMHTEHQQHHGSLLGRN